MMKPVEHNNSAKGSLLLRDRNCKDVNLRLESDQYDAIKNSSLNKIKFQKVPSSQTYNRNFKGLNSSLDPDLTGYEPSNDIIRLAAAKAKQKHGNSALKESSIRVNLYYKQQKSSFNGSD